MMQFYLLIAIIFSTILMVIFLLQIGKQAGLILHQFAYRHKNLESYIGKHLLLSPKLGRETTRKDEWRYKVLKSVRQPLLYLTRSSHLCEKQNRRKDNCQHQQRSTKVAA